MSFSIQPAKKDGHLSGQRKYDIPHSNTFRKELAYSFLLSVQWIQSKAGRCCHSVSQTHASAKKHFNQQ